jgi:hypothetical protein
MTTEIRTNPVGQESDKAGPPMTKESVAISIAVADMAKGRECEADRLAAVKAFQEEQEAARAKLPEKQEHYLSKHWEIKLAEMSANHAECASQMRGIRRRLYDWLVDLKALQERYDNPAPYGATINSGIELAIKLKLGRLGLLPTTPNYRDLLVTAALHPDGKLPDEQEDKARRVAIQKKDSTYRKVFKEAERAAITSETMLPWLEEHGIEAIRLGRWKTKEQQQADKAEADRKAAAEKALVDAFTSDVRNSQPRFSFPIEPKHIAWNAQGDHHEMVLLVTYRPTSGTMDVMHVAKGPAAFDAVIRVASKAPPAVTEEDHEEEAEA